MKVMAGPEKKSRLVTEKERKLTAYHEAGHAVAGYFLPHSDPVHYITIIPRGASGGMTVYRPEEDTSYSTRSEMFERIVSAMGGRVSEKIFLDDISTGASGDIQQATNIARAMVTKYGFSEKLGPISFDSSDHSIFIGRDFGQTKSYSEKIATEIDEEVKHIFDEAMKMCEKLLRDHADLVEKTAQYLLENESMEGDMFRYLCKNGELPPKKEEPEAESTEHSQLPAENSGAEADGASSDAAGGETGGSYFEEGESDDKYDR